MLRRYDITLGATTTAGGRVITASPDDTILGVPVAVEGDEVECPKCNSVGVIVPDGPRLSDTILGRQIALSDDLCLCKCDPPPRMVAIQDFTYQEVDPGYFAAQAAAAVAQSPANAQAGMSDAGPDDEVAIRLLHPETREPFRHRAYTLQLGNKTISGTTDGAGCTKALSAAERASIVSWHVDGVSGA